MRRQGQPGMVLRPQAAAMHGNGRCRQGSRPARPHRRRNQNRGVVRDELGKTVLVHCYVWERLVGPIPDGMVIDHQCRNRACCNIDHLRVVTPKQNVTENIVGCNWQLNAAKTHCKRVHEFTPENTRSQNGGRGRFCKTCFNIVRREWRAAQRMKIQKTNLDTSARET